MVWDLLPQVTLEIKGRSGLKNREVLGEQVHWQLMQQSKSSLQLKVTKQMIAERIPWGNTALYVI